MSPLEMEVRKLEGEGSYPSRQVTALVIGCGNRGQAYSSYALDLPGRLKIVAVADPLKHRTARVRCHLRLGQCIFCCIQQNIEQVIFVLQIQKLANFYLVNSL